MQIIDDGTIEGVGDFSTVTVLGCALTAAHEAHDQPSQPQWYYEVELLTGGVMQIGWADQLFKADAMNGDGVGDDVHSWAYDGTEQYIQSGATRGRWGGAQSFFLGTFSL